VYLPWSFCTTAQLVQALEWCLELGVPCVSVYAFSLENFNRSAAEVAVLMDLAEQKLLAILQVGHYLQQVPAVSMSCRMQPQGPRDDMAFSHHLCSRSPACLSSNPDA
jgi:Putative undecaprenyl diphosphate synthase